jgi:hypothetical protein
VCAPEFDGSKWFIKLLAEKVHFFGHLAPYSSVKEGVRFGISLHGAVYGLHRWPQSRGGQRPLGLRHEIAAIVAGQQMS